MIAYLEDYAARFDLPVELGSPRARGLGGRASASCSTSASGRSKPTRWSSQPDRSRSRACRSFARELAADLSRCTALATASRATSRRERCSSSAEGTPASRSRRSSPRSHEVHLAVGSSQMPLPQTAARAAISSLARAARADAQDRRLAARAAHAGPRRADRLQPARSSGATASSCRPARSEPPAGRSRSPTASELEVDAVIWATGYGLDHSWIDAPVFYDDGRIRHRRGVTDVTGPVLPRPPWQYTRGLGAARLGQGRRGAHREAGARRGRDATQGRGGLTARQGRRFGGAGSRHRLAARPADVPCIRHA